MNQNNGYIYIRNHPSYDMDDACKMGKTINIPGRDTQYATGEIKRGNFELVFEIPIEKLGIIERLLKYEFREFNVKYDAGTEFFNKQIINLIEPYLIKLGIKYKNLTKQDISNLIRRNKVIKTIKKINIQSLIHFLKSTKTNNKQQLENNENCDLKIVREVICQMGLEDENITQKIKMCHNGSKKQKYNHDFCEYKCDLISEKMENEFECEICNKFYSNKISLMNHNRNIHGIKKYKLNIDFRCQYCNKNYSCYKSKWRHQKDCAKKRFVDPKPMKQEIEKNQRKKRIFEKRK